jgi:general secretion pathway protein H
MPIKNRVIHSCGFSLIELLVVIAILGVLFTMATLAVNSVGGERQLEREAIRIQSLLDFVCDQAQLSGFEYGLVLANRSYGFVRLEGNEWILVSDPQLRVRELPEGMVLSAARQQRQLKIDSSLPVEPQSVCYPSGEMTPVSIKFSINANPNHYVVSAEWDGRTGVKSDHDL